MKNTIENKAKFFALYYSKERIVFRKGFNNRSNTSPSLIDEADFLELKSLSQITDEDALWIAKEIFIFDFIEKKSEQELILKVKEHMSKVGMSFCTSIERVDRFRGNGYTLDWTTPEGETITVKEQIEFGWIKIKE